MRKLLVGIACLLTITITGCGGGGGGGSSTASTDASTISGASVTVDGVKYTCGDSIQIAANCVAFKYDGTVVDQTLGISVVSSATNIPMSDGITYSGFLLKNLKDGDAIIFTSGIPRTLYFYSFDGAYYNFIVIVYFDKAGDSDWASNVAGLEKLNGYWLAMLTDNAFAVGW